MKELYSNEPNLVFHKIHLRGTPMRPEDGTVFAVLNTGNSKDRLSGAIELPIEATDRGVYEIIVKQDLLRKYRYAQIVVEYELFDYGRFTDTTTYEIAQRLIGFTEVNDSLGEEYAISYDQYSEIETNVRMVIESFCNQKFNCWEGKAEVRSPEGHIGLPQHMERLDNVVVRARISGDLEFDVAEGGYVLSDTGYSISNPDRIETVNMFRAPSSDNINHVVDGVWGYYTAPTAVQAAALELVKGWLCDDIEYRKRYLDNIRSGDMRLQFNPMSYVDSTGNPIVDQMLAPYRIFEMGAV